MDIRYPAVLEAQEGGGWFVRFPDLDDTFTEGASREEALFNAGEVLSAMLSWRLDNDRPIPESTAGLANAVYIAPDARTQSALLIRRARGERSLADIARVLQTTWPAAERLEDPHHWPSLRQLDRAAAALGKRLVLRFE